MRKTVKVETLKDKVNKMLRDLPDSDVEGRIALQTLVENVLMESGNYCGFCYLDKRDMIDSRGGTTVGINLIVQSDKDHKSVYRMRFANTDHTRVRYF